MIKKILTSTKNHLLSFTQTQLAITLVSLPILVSWGLGISIMTLIGNLIFPPLLTLFLIISTLVLFTQLFGAPNGILLKLLDDLTWCWDQILQHGSASWVYSCAKPHTIVLIIIPVITYIALQHRTINTYFRRCSAMSLLLAASYGIFFMQRHQSLNVSAPLHFHDKLTVQQVDKSSSIMIIDNGYFTRKKSPEKSIDYELKPWLAKQFGDVTITQLSISKLSVGALRAIKHLSATWRVESVMIKTTGKYFDLSSLKKYLAEKKITLTLESA